MRPSLGSPQVTLEPSGPLDLVSSTWDLKSVGPGQTPAHSPSADTWRSCFTYLSSAWCHRCAAGCQEPSCPLAGTLVGAHLETNDAVACLPGGIIKISLLLLQILDSMSIPLYCPIVLAFPATVRTDTCTCTCIMFHSQTAHWT